MPDDLSLTIDGLLHFFSNKEQRHGRVNAKTSLLETVRLGVETAAHLHQKYNGEASHPQAASFDPLLTGNLEQVQQAMHRIAQTFPESGFVEFCNGLIDYSASITDRAKRVHAGILLFTLGQARAEAQTAQGAFNPPFAPQRVPQDSPYPMQGQRAAIEAPATPHPSEKLFKRYMELGGRDGAEELGQDFGQLDRERAIRLFKAFRDYAASLRTTGEIKTAMQISERLAIIYERKFLHQQAALSAPTYPH